MSLDSGSSGARHLTTLSTVRRKLISRHVNRVAVFRLSLSAHIRPLDKTTVLMQLALKNERHDLSLFGGAKVLTYSKIFFLRLSPS